MNVRTLRSAERSLGVRHEPQNVGIARSQRMHTLRTLITVLRSRRLWPMDVAINKLQSALVTTGNISYRRLIHGWLDASIILRREALCLVEGLDVGTHALNALLYEALGQSPCGCLQPAQKSIFRLHSVWGAMEQLLNDGLPN